MSYRAYLATYEDGTTQLVAAPNLAAAAKKAQAAEEKKELVKVELTETVIL